MVGQFAIKTKIKFIEPKSYNNHSAVIIEMLNRKYVFMCDTQIGESIIPFMNSRYSIRFHLSEQKAFLSFMALAMRKSLSEQITDKINKM